MNAEPSVASQPGRSRLAAALVAVLVGLFAVLALRTAWMLPDDIDERAYVIIGRLNLTGNDWSGDLSTHLGPLSLYGSQLGLLGVPDAELLPNPSQHHFHRARTALLVFGLLAAGLVFLWSRRLFGTAGGVLSLALYCLNPTVIGYAGVLNVDMTHAATTTLLALVLWRFLVRPRPLAAAMLGAAFGLAVGTKFLALLLAPVVALAVLLGGSAMLADASDTERSGHGGRGLARRALGILAAAALCAGAACLVLHALYQFRGGFSPLDPDAYASERFRRLLAFPGGGALVAPWPWPLVRGVDLLGAIDAGEGRVYLRGAFRDEPRSYYVWTFLTKTPEPILAAVVLGAAAWAWRLARRRGGPAAGRAGAAAAGEPWSRAPEREERLAAAVLAAAFLVPLALLTFAVHRKIGVRYALQLVPLLCVAGGALAPAALGLLRARAARVAGGAVALAAALYCAAEAVAASPNALAYFNRASGGEREAWRWFLDSNSDFGQYRGEKGLRVLRARTDQPFEVLRGPDGPRFGRVAVYLTDLVTDPARPGGGPHWVVGLEPVLHLDAAWWVFDATPEALRALADAEEGAAGARRREQLAEAYWRAGERELARAELARVEGDPLLGRVLAWEDAAAAGPVDAAAAAAGLALAHEALVARRPALAEGLLAHPGWPASAARTVLRARALELRERFAEAADLVERDPALPRSPELVLLLAYLWRRLGDPSEGLATLDRHADLLAGLESAARLRAELEDLRARGETSRGLQ